MDTRVIDAHSRSAAATRGWRADVRVAAVPIMVTAITAAGIVLRVYGLTKGLWFDEAYSFFIARQSLWDVPRLLRLYDTHPPLYYALLHLWMGLVGRGEAAMRVPSLVAGVLAIPLTFLFARRLAGDAVGVLAAAFVATSPYLIAASQEARMYAVLTVFALGATYALLLGIAGRGRRHWIAYALLMVLALYTHHFALLVLLAHAAYMLAVYRRGTAVRRWLACGLVVALVYLPLVPSLPSQVATVRSWPSIRPPLRPGDLTDVFALWSFGGGLFGTATYFRKGFYSDVIPETCILSPLRFTDPSPPRVCLDQPAYPLVVLVPFALLILAGLTRLERRGRLLALAYWLVPFLVVALISLQWNLFQKRYFTFLMPPFTVLLASGVLQTVRAARRVRPAAAAAALLVLLGSYIVPSLMNFYTAPPTHDWRAAAGYVSTRAGPDDVLLFMPAFTRLPFEYYFAGPQARFTINPEEILEGRRTVGFRVEADREVMAALARRHPRMWIIAAAPIGVEGRRALFRQVSGSFREADSTGFGNVSVFRWNSLGFIQESR